MAVSFVRMIKNSEGAPHDDDVHVCTERDTPTAWCSVRVLSPGSEAQAQTRFQIEQLPTLVFVHASQEPDTRASSILHHPHIHKCHIVLRRCLYPWM